jgi:hypothetical protein
MPKPLHTVTEQTKAEINLYLDRLIEAGELLVADHITSVMLQKHRSGRGMGEAALWWEHHTHASVRDLVRVCINNRADDPIDPEKDYERPTLPGFECLQDYYMVSRKLTKKDTEPTRIGVPTQLCTNIELRGKSRTYRRAGATIYKHADEIDRYVDLRDEAEALAAEKAAQPA